MDLTLFLDASKANEVNNDINRNIYVGIVIKYYIEGCLSAKMFGRKLELNLTRSQLGKSFVADFGDITGYVF